MKSLLLVLSVFGLAQCQHWGQPGVPQDTPEVAAAKAAHLAALARVGSQPQQQNWASQPQQQWAPQPAPAASWQQAAPGVPQDTPEVAAAKAAHFAALARVAPSSQQPQQQWSQPQQQWNQPAQNSWNSRWNGPVALPPGFDQNGAPLPVQDTPEVQAERARHFNLYSSGNHITQTPSWNSAPAPSWNSAPAPSWNAAPSWKSAPTWNPAPAAPSWNQQQPGLPADTPEVAAAKAAHFAAHAQLG